MLKRPLDLILEATTPIKTIDWSGMALPLVRKVFGSIAAKDFVTVQPMNLPTGLVFYMDTKFSTAWPEEKSDA